ncbi:MAG: TPM domain-containing protein [Propionibacteriaceae bacterium]|nr:TPM domain-containing protein [Propionibacteriaceae bacterium]
MMNMRRKGLKWLQRFVAATFLGLSFSFAATGSAVADVNRVFDEDNLLSTTQRATLNAKLSEISAKHDFELVAASVATLGGKSADLAASDFYEATDFGADGAILIISLSEREFGFAAHGFGMYACTLDCEQLLFDTVQPFLSDGRYFDGYVAWVDAMDRMLGLAREGTPWSKAQQDKEEMTTVGYVISLITGAITAIFIPSRWRSQLKSVKPQPSADFYASKNGFQVLNHADTFINRTVAKIPIPKQTSSSSSGFSSGGGFNSSGTSYSGFSGKF